MRVGSHHTHLASPEASRLKSLLDQYDGVYDRNTPTVVSLTGQTATEDVRVSTDTDPRQHRFYEWGVTPDGDIWLEHEQDDELDVQTVGIQTVVRRLREHRYVPGVASFGDPANREMADPETVEL